METSLELRSYGETSNEKRQENLLISLRVDSERSWKLLRNLGVRNLGIRTRVKPHCKLDSGWVPSSCLCKNSEGAVFPIAVKAAKNRKDNPVHAMHVDKTDHGSSSTAHFHKTALDHIGRPQLSPQMLGECKN